VTTVDPIVELFCDRLQRLVAIDSPSGTTAQELVAAELAAWLEPLGAVAEWIEEPDYPARSLALTLPGDGVREVALLGHADTVFPAGTAATRPFQRAGDRCLGPGVADMKGGLVLGAMAMERLAAHPLRPFAAVRLIVCADEEVRVRAPRATALAAGAAAALVFECARENGDLVSARKGALWRTLELTGVPAHAGADTARGRSAVSALAREIIRIEALPRGRPAMTSVVTTVHAGEAANSVPAHALATVDIRSSDAADIDHALAALTAGGAYDGVSIDVTDRGTWPPMPPAPALLETAVRLARELGLPAGHELSGGVSDGCWTGAAGIPTLDGLGPRGGRDHTPDEWIEVASVPARIELAAAMVEAVCAAPTGAYTATPATRATGR
jgi:glutamate carboxypeptidase